MPPIRVAVIGAGAFGRNHLRVYRELEQAHPDLVQLAAVVDSDPTRREIAATTYNIPAFASVADALDTSLGGPSFRALGERVGCLPHDPTTSSALLADAASICVPTHHHASVAEQLLHANLDLLIEKPFAASLAEADRILTLAQQRNRIVAIGHLERFNPAVTAVAQRLNHPMFFEAHRLSIFTPRSLDVDVVLDLMIHDLDIVLSLTNSPVQEVRAVGLPVLSRKTDIANVRIEFASGCVANFTASRVSTEQVRKLRLFQPHQYLSLDFARQELLSIDVDPNLVAALSAAAKPEAGTLPPHQLSSFAAPGSPTSAFGSLGWSGGGPASRAAAAASPANNQVPQGFSPGFHIPQDKKEALASGAHPSPGLNLQKLDLPRAEPLRLELENFLQSVRTRTQPRVNATAGRAALALALQINEEISTHAHRTGLILNP